MEEDESDCRTSTTAIPAAAANNTKNSRNANNDNSNNPSSPIPSPTPNRKAISYSQPLSHHNPPSLSRRKHSLDDDRSLSYSHHLSSPPPAFFPHHPNLPPPHQLHSIGGSSSSLTLERAMSEYGGAPGSLPEFTGGGGNTGIFRVPIRAAMHPARPPALELRTHPLRETQAGSFLRALAANGDQLWAASESGLRVWNLSDVWATHAGGGRRGDEESARFYETGRTSPVMCLAADQASRIVWSGHKDGKIRSWKMDLRAVTGSGSEDGSRNGSGSCFTEGLAWQAHARDPVLSMVITSYG